MKNKEMILTEVTKLEERISLSRPVIYNITRDEFDFGTQYSIHCKELQFNAVGNTFDEVRRSLHEEVIRQFDL
jgi:hypothetical protein